MSVESTLLKYHGLEEASQTSIDQSAERTSESFGSLTVSKIFKDLSQYCNGNSGFFIERANLCPFSQNSNLIN
jgi:hypothetical protein